MAKNWQKIQTLFSKVITPPLLQEEYLKSPSPNYLYGLIKNTMNKTGFLNGLFSPEEEATKYFIAKKEHKIKFFTKVIDITKIITKTNFNLDYFKYIKLFRSRRNIYIFRKFL